MEDWGALDLWPQPFTVRISSDGRIDGPRGITQGTADSRGYRVVTLFAPEKKRKRFYVHRLVALAFIPNPLGLPQINHIDGNRSNNRAENLEWCTASHNQLHAIKNGLRMRNSWNLDNISKAARGTAHGNSRLTEENVREMRRLREDGASFEELASTFGIKRQTAWIICARKRWRHIP